MKIRLSRPLVGLALISVLGASAFAQTQVLDDPKFDAARFIKELKEIKEKQKTVSSGAVEKAVADFKNGGNNPLAAMALYQNALKATKNQSESDVAELTNMPTIQLAASIHLRYLVLTIQKALGATTERLENDINAYIAAVQQAYNGDAAVWTRREKARAMIESGNRGVQKKGMLPPDKEPLFAEQKLVTGSVKDSPFVQWYGIQNVLADVKDWEMNPGNIDGIYQSTLLPYYRQKKDQRILAYWDQKMATEEQKIRAGGSEFKVNQFATVTRPQLYWNKAKDEIAIGLKNKGISDMATLVRTFPGHPDAADWINQIEAILNVPKPDASAQPASQPAAQPAPAGLPAQ